MTEPQHPTGPHSGFDASDDAPAPPPMDDTAAPDNETAPGNESTPGAPDDGHHAGPADDAAPGPRHAAGPEHADEPPPATPGELSGSEPAGQWGAPPPADALEDTGPVPPVGPGDTGSMPPVGPGDTGAHPAAAPPPDQGAFAFPPYQAPPSDHAAPPPAAPAPPAPGAPSGPGAPPGPAAPGTTGQMPPVPGPPPGPQPQFQPGPPPGMPPTGGAGMPPGQPPMGPAAPGPGTAAPDAAAPAAQTGPIELPRAASRVTANLLGSLAGIVLVGVGLALLLRLGGYGKPQDITAGGVDWAGFAWTVIGAIVIATAALLARWASWTPIVPGAVLTGLSAWVMATPLNGGFSAVWDASDWAVDSTAFAALCANGLGFTLGLTLLLAGIAAVLLRAGVRKQIKRDLQRR